jgi:hypothetical protein
MCSAYSSKPCLGALASFVQCCGRCLGLAALYGHLSSTLLNTAGGGTSAVLMLAIGERSEVDRS